MNNIELLNALRPLTQDERQTAQAKARTAVLRAAGDRPVRRTFQRELGSLFTLLDLLALLVFCPALIVSSIHIIQHMGALAAGSYGQIAPYTTGTVITGDLYTAVHQWALIPLAEASMLLFLVMFAMSARDWRKWVFFVLSVAAALFIVIANAQSGIGLLESILAPLFTIGVGLHLEGLIVRSLKRRDEVNSRYLEALHNWEVATANPEQHGEYMQRYANSLKDAIYKANIRRAAIKDLVVADWRSLVKREIAADQWYEDVQLPGGASPLPLSESVDSSSGNIPHAQDEHAFIQMTPLGSERGTGVNGRKPNEVRMVE